MNPEKKYEFGVLGLLKQGVVRAGAVASGTWGGYLRAGAGADIVDRVREVASLSGVRAVRDAVRMSPNAHCEWLDRHRELDRMLTFNRCISALAHELGNPLNVVELRAQMIATGDSMTRQQVRKNAEIMLEQVQRMTRILKHRLPVSSNAERSRTQVDLAVVIRSAISAVEPIYPNTALLFDSHKAQVSVEGDADSLMLLVANLLLNGCKAMKRGGVLRIALGEERWAPAGAPLEAQQEYARITITDRGVGIASESLARIFSPFFSLTGGVGLGLSVAEDIARTHGGFISAESRFGQGSRFEVRLSKRMAQSGEA